MQNFRLNKLQLVALLALLFAATVGLLSIPANADELYARIRGTITDPTGAVVPGAQLKLTNTLTGITFQSSSGSDGSFLFINLQPGTYELEGSKSGFRTFHVKGMKIIQNEIFVQNIAVELGGVTETVEVQANPTQVDQTSMQLGATLSGQTITDLPLVTRNWITLQQSLPGVVASESRFGNNYATNGSQAQQNSFLVNGTDTNDLPLNSPVVIPSPDSIGEVQMVTNTINPEYGRNSGAIMNALTKAGTNAFHGDGFEFLRDTSMNGRRYFQRTPSIFHQNQYGGTIGGPVWKDHTFFFFSYQGSKFRQAEAGGSTKTLTQAQRNGDFHNPATGACAIGAGASPFALEDSTGTTQPAGTPFKTLFPTCIVPTADFNTISNNLLPYLPLPNAPSLGPTNYVFSPVLIGTVKQTIVRGDHNFSSKDAVWGSWLWQTAPQNETLPFTGSTLPGFGDQQQAHVNESTAAWSHTFSGSTLNELRFGSTRNNFVAVSPQKVVQPSSLGFDINSQNTAGAGVPRISVSGLFNLGFSSNGPQPRVDTTFQVTDNFSKVVGKHSLKAGFEGRSFMVANPFYGNNNGTFSFNHSNAAFTSGITALDFMLGIPATYLQGSGGHIDATAKEFYTYFQDVWRATNELTVTYGVGYQVDTPIAQNYNAGVSTNCFRADEQSKVFTSAPTGLVFPGDPGCNKQSGVTTKYGHFGPRLGFAYSPRGTNGKMSVRGGFGIYYNRSEEELLLQFLGAPPFSINSNGAADLGGSPGFANPYADVAGRAGLSEANKFPFTAPHPGDSSVNFGIYEPLSINLLAPKFGTPYSMNYHLTLERELAAKTIVTVGYVGSTARKLITSTEGNPITQAGHDACVADPTCNAATGTGYLFQHVVYPDHSVYPGDVFASLGTEGTRANSWYNSLQVTANKAMTHGVSFYATYTWSHSIDENSSYEELAFTGLRGNNPIAALDRGDSAFDARHRIALTYTYEVPKIHSNGLVNRVVNGWRISGITTYQTGFPVNVGDSGFTSFFCDAFEYYSCWDRPNLVAPVHLVDPRKLTDFGQGPQHYWFDPNSFAPAAFGTFGNLGRNAFHGAGISNTDAIVAKDTHFTERVHMELRFEFFNVFNHTQFLMPDNASYNSAQYDVQQPGSLGTILTARAPRIIQLGAKITF